MFRLVLGLVEGDEVVLADGAAQADLALRDIGAEGAVGPVEVGERTLVDGEGVLGAGDLARAPVAPGVSPVVRATRRTSTMGTNAVTTPSSSSKSSLGYRAALGPMRVAPVSGKAAPSSWKAAIHQCSRSSQATGSMMATASHGATERYSTAIGSGARGCSSSWRSDVTVSCVCRSADSMSRRWATMISLRAVWSAVSITCLICSSGMPRSRKRRITWPVGTCDAS